MQGLVQTSADPQIPGLVLYPHSWTVDAIVLHVNHIQPSVIVGQVRQSGNFPSHRYVVQMTLNLVPLNLDWVDRSVFPPQLLSHIPKVRVDGDNVVLSLSATKIFVHLQVTDIFNKFTPTVKHLDTGTISEQDIAGAHQPDVCGAGVSASPCNLPIQSPFLAEYLRTWLVVLQATRIVSVPGKTATTRPSHIESQTSSAGSWADRKFNLC